jgi:hypothetical protein
MPVSWSRRSTPQLGPAGSPPALGSGRDLRSGTLSWESSRQTRTPGFLASESQPRVVPPRCLSSSSGGLGHGAPTLVDYDQRQLTRDNDI